MLQLHGSGNKRHWLVRTLQFKGFTMYISVDYETRSQDERLMAAMRGSCHVSLSVHSECWIRLVVIRGGSSLRTRYRGASVSQLTTTAIHLFLLVQYFLDYLPDPSLISSSNQLLYLKFYESCQRFSIQSIVPGLSSFTHLLLPPSLPNPYI